MQEISSYTYGTTRLGDGSIPFEERVAVARAAMNADVWFHTSHQYGDALQVLRAAFDQDRAHVPPAIFKIGWNSIAQIREQIQQNIEPLHIERMGIGQLCLGGEIAEAFRTGDAACYEGLRQIKADGLANGFVLEVWPWNSQMLLDALRGGFAESILDGVIFYLNPLQRFVSNALWDELRARNVPIFAMRTVSGGDVFRLRDGENTPDYLRQRAAQVAPLFERSGCASWTEFCVRFVYGFPQVKTTVGSTSHAERLNEFLQAAKNPQPLPNEIHAELERLQRQWADDHDQHAAPWSM